jgi:hypothetical protein
MQLISALPSDLTHPALASRLWIHLAGLALVYISIIDTRTIMSSLSVVISSIFLHM